MRKQVKHGMHAAGDSARSVAKSLGISTSDAAKYVGAWGIALVQTLGVRRALIGTALVGGAIGGGLLVARQLRRRRQAARDWESMQASDAAMTRRRHMHAPAS